MKKVKEPKNSGIAKTPLIMQLENLECGAASLAMVMAYYGKWVSLEQLREDAGVTKDGSNATSIFKAAAKYGFKTQGYYFSLKLLMERAKFPCIIHWQQAHFVVLNGFSRDKKFAYINDPSKGVMKVPIEEFQKSYNRVYLEIIPGEDFFPSGERKSMFAFAKKRLVNAKGIVIFFGLITAAFYAIGIFDPIFRKKFIDEILGRSNTETLMPFIIAVAGVGLASIILTLIQQVSSLKIYGKLAYEGSASFMSKLLRLPIAFFSTRHVGDIQDRKDSNAKIAETIVNVFAPLALNAIIIVVYLVLMIQNSPLLALIGVCFAAINAVVTQCLVRKHLNIQRVQARDSAMLSAATSKGIEMIETIKSSGAEDSFFYQWTEYKNAVSDSQKKLATNKALYGIVPGLLYMVIQYGVLFVGIAATISGSYTLGMVLAFQGLMACFMNPVSSLASSGQTLQETRTSMERVEDVMNYDDDPNVTKDIQPTSEDKLSGAIEITDVTFGYNKLRKPLIDHLNLSIHRGEKIAIVGKTGCGKSTLSKLISGLYSPWSGDISFDGAPVLDIARDTFTSSVAVVDQDVFLFEDSVANNLRMWKNDISDEELKQACIDADIYDAIQAWTDGFNHKILEGGKNLSGGEKQRMEIARALARNPSVLILDEATSALDAKTEDNIIAAIARRGITCIIIAHRLSTIRDADKIIVLSRGKIVEEGNHEQLMEREGFYASLVRNA